MKALKPVEKEMDNCIRDMCLNLHKAAQKHHITFQNGISSYQRSFKAEDFEKYYLPKIDVRIFMEMEAAQDCVAKCKRPETIFNRATVAN